MPVQQNIYEECSKWKYKITRGSLDSYAYPDQSQRNRHMKKLFKTGTILKENALCMSKISTEEARKLPTFRQF